MEPAIRDKLQALGRQAAAVQAEVFLRAFCGTFTGSQRSAVFEEVLEAAAAFETALEVNTERTGVRRVDLEEDLAHQFLESHGHPLTVVEMRAAFVQLDLDQSHRVRRVPACLPLCMHTPVDLPRAAVDGLVVHTPHARPAPLINQCPSFSPVPVRLPVRWKTPPRHTAWVAPPPQSSNPPKDAMPVLNIRALACW